ncbi:UNVERIFIED_ORG: hypothetical protein B2H98_17015 [Clostridium botulinum]
MIKTEQKPVSFMEAVASGKPIDMNNMYIDTMGCEMELITILELMSEKTSKEARDMILNGRFYICD